MFFMAASPRTAPPDLEIDYEQIFYGTCLEFGLTRKEAAAMMLVDESYLGKALRGEPHHSLCLRKIMRLPPTFNAAFLMDVLKAAVIAWARRAMAELRGINGHSETARRRVGDRVGGGSVSPRPVSADRL